MISNNSLWHYQQDELSDSSQSSLFLSLLACFNFNVFVVNTVFTSYGCLVIQHESFSLTVMSLFGTFSAIMLRIISGNLSTIRFVKLAKFKVPINVHQGITDG